MNDMNQIKLNVISIALLDCPPDSPTGYDLGKNYKVKKVEKKEGKFYFLVELLFGKICVIFQERSWTSETLLTLLSLL